MSKRNKSSAPRRKKQGSLTYQIKHMELERKEKKDTPMLKKTENQYKKHALKYAEWAKSIYGCKTLDDCRAHIQDYGDGDCADPAVELRRTALQQYRYGVHQKLRRHLLGGLCHFAVLYYFLAICIQSARRNRRTCPGNGRLELHWRAGIQYAGARRLHQNV